MSHSLSPGPLPPPTRLKSHPFDPRDTHLSQALTPPSASAPSSGPCLPRLGPAPGIPRQTGVQLWAREPLQAARHPPPGTGPWARLPEEEGLPRWSGFPGHPEASLPGLVHQHSSEPASVGGKPRPSHRITGHSPEALGVFGGQSWLSGLLLPLAEEAA